MKGLCREVEVLFHHNELILHLDIVRGQTVGGDHRSLKEECCRPNMIEVLMGQDDEVNVAGL